MASKRLDTSFMEEEIVVGDSEETVNEIPVEEPKEEEEKVVVEEKPKSNKKSKTIVEEVPVNETKVKGTVVIEKDREKKIQKQVKKQAKKSAKLEKKMIKARKKALKKGRRTIVRFETDPINGLSAEIVDQREKDGLINKNDVGGTKTVGKIIRGNVFTFFNFLIVVIAACLIFVNAFTDLLFLFIATLNTVLGTIQEIRAKMTVDRLSILNAPTAVVIRDGKQYEIKVTEVVLDDLLYLEAGKQICADSIVINGNIEVNESLLTGESDSIVKKPGDVLYAGSFVVSGKCNAVVDKIGKDNYIQTLTAQVKKYRKPNSDLMKALNTIIKVMTFILVPIGLFLFYMQYVQNNVELVTAVRKTAGAMIGMIPSGLFLLTSVALYLSVIRLGQNNVLVQELYCIEMLARTNTICLDKTGTITDGTMSVRNVIEYNTIEGLTTKGIVSGIMNALKDQNLTSKALQEYFGLSKRIKASATIPFSSQRKYQAVTFDKYGTFILGAPEFILKEKYKVIESEVNSYAKKGYRVLLLAHMEGKISNSELPESECTIISLILIEDNVRPDAISTIAYFRNSGVDVKVISGDNPITVSKISERAGIENASNYISLDGLSDEDVIRAATKYTVFGRVSPAQKKLLVHTLKEEGKIVAMTGDGVNDILALKEADCSIAVASGSEAARNVSQLVLLDSNFDSMPKVVSEGRRVINNIANVASLFLTKTIFSFLLAIQALQSGGIYPISTLQLVIIEMFAIAIPCAVLVLEPNNKEVEGKFLFNIIKGALPGALVILVNSIIVFALVEMLNLKFIDSSTIIVISATHTCMCVLFKVCKPFNTLRRTLCVAMYSVFIICITFLPSFFEFTPIIFISEYYSNDLVVETPRNVPTVNVSKDGYYVIDGMVTEFNAPINTSTFTFSSYGKNGSYYLIVNGTPTNYVIKNPNLTISSDSEYIAQGVVTTFKYSSDMKLICNSDGNICINDVSSESCTNVNIMPTVTISSDGNYVINEKNIGIQAVKEIHSVKIDSNFQIIINGKPINYYIEEPSISYNEAGYLVIGGTKTGVYANTDTVDYNPNITLNGGSYYINNQKTSLEIGTISEISPKLETSVEGYYVLDGRYTSYKVNGDRTQIQISVDSSGYYCVNGITTDILAEMEYSYGGTVETLGTSATLLLATLCLLAGPMIRIFEGVIPWLKKQYHGAQSFIAKM